MLAVSNSIKNAYNQYTTKRKSKIKVGNNEYFIQNMSLLADAYDEGNIVGNAIAKTLEFDIETEYVKGLDEFVLYDGVWTGEQYEYINLGTFKLFEEQGADDFFSHITAYDKLILFKTEFNPNLVQFPTTIYGLLQSICSQAGVTLDTETIVNGDKTLETNLFVENETLKDILRAICQVSGTFAVISEDKLKLKLVGEDVIELEDYQISNPEYKRTTWNINQVVLGMQDIDGEYVQKSDEEDIERNGVHKIVINNNPFTYTQELRQQYIDDLFDKLKGFGYFAFESDWEGLPYVELGDTARIGKEQSYDIDLGVENLLPNNATSQAINGLTFTVNTDKSITVNGTATANTNYSIVGSNNIATEVLSLKANQNYYNTTSLRLVYRLVNGNYGAINSGAFTVANDLSIRHIYLSITSGTTFTNETIYPQIIKGTKASSYSEYGLIPIELCKIDDYQDSIRKGTGKNLLDNSKIVKGRLDNGNIGYAEGTTELQTTDNYIAFTTNVSYRGVVTDFIPISPTTQYTFSCIANSVSIYIDYYNSSKIWLSRVQQTMSGNISKTITSIENAHYVRISFQLASAGTITINNLMLEQNNQATDYEPYGSKGKWLLTKKIGKVVLDGSERWSYQTSSGYPRCTLNSLYLIKGYSDTNRHTGYFICSHFTPNTTDGTGHMYQYQRTILCNPTSDITSVNDFKAWLSTHNVSLYYVLETPTIEEITDSSLINQLENAGVEILGETTQEGTPTPTNPVPINNKTGEITVKNKRKSLVLRYQIKSPDGLNSYLQAPSIIDSVIDYIDNTNDLDTRMRRTEYKIDKANGQITSIVENVDILQNQTSTNANNINNLTSLVNSQGEEIDTLGTRITQTAENITASVSAIQEEIDNGVGLVKTTSVTIDDSGLNVSTDTSKISTTMTNNSFEIKDNGDKRLAFFGYDEQEGISKAEMDNLTVTNYFIAGVHRVETIEVDGEQRTGYFYIGG